MTKEQIKKICQTSIDLTRSTAKQTSIENLKLIIKELELNPDEFEHNDVQINYIVFKEELDLKTKKL
jgi:hypothetical protein